MRDAVAAGAAIVGIAAVSGWSDNVRRNGTISFLRGEPYGRPFLMSADGGNQRRAAVPSYPTYSPDGRKVAFSIPASGGRRLQFARRGRLYVANADSSGRRAISRLTDTCFGPEWSPDGTKIAYEDGCEADFTTIYLANRDGSGRRKLDPGYWQAGPTWSPDGKRILFSAVVHPEKAGARWRLYVIAPNGRGRRMIRGRYRDATQWQWAPDGKRIYFVAKVEDEWRLFVMRADGTALRRLSPPGLKIREYEVSPDGRSIVFTGAPDEGSKDWEIYVLNSAGTGVRQLTDNRAFDIEPIWSPDGRTIAFTSLRDGNSEIYAMNADGSDQANLSRNRAADWSPSWVPQRRRGTTASLTD